MLWLAGVLIGGGILAVIWVVFHGAGPFRW